MSDRIELLVIGGGPAGLAAARGYRKLRRDGEVAIVADEHRMPYQRPPLTKELLRGETGFDQLAIEDEDWLTEQRVQLISGRAVTLDADARTVELSGGRSLTYGTCLLATGAEPTRLPIPGADHPRVRVVRTADHVRELLDAPERRRPGHGDRVRVHRLRDRRIAADPRSSGRARLRRDRAQRGPAGRRGRHDHPRLAACGRGNARSGPRSTGSSRAVTRRP